ncbi:uncharacterized protein LOC142776506 isoform X4 [Rhipicephalus microplus]|uniref:uncharacterized protein LOC142776506 isoform X4 n=1 Tax=Rhipicephalus microplus TaxID=6941 RepID=UPI003F6B45A1
MTTLDSRRVPHITGEMEVTLCLKNTSTMPWDKTYLCLSSWNDSKGQCRSRNKVLQDQCFDISRPSCTCGSLRQGNVDSSTWDLINILNTELTIACPQHDTPVSTSARLWSARLPACSCFLHRGAAAVHEKRKSHPSAHTPAT